MGGYRQGHWNRIPGLACVEKSTCNTNFFISQDSSKESLQYLANCLAGKARRLAYDPNYLSPFAINAKKVGIDIKGGKPDDITVLISVISSKDA